MLQLLAYGQIGSELLIFLHVAVPVTFSNVCWAFHQPLDLGAMGYWNASRQPWITLTSDETQPKEAKHGQHHTTHHYHCTDYSLWWRFLRPGTLVLGCFTV